MNYHIIFEEQALLDIRKIKNSGQNIVLKKLDQILEELKVHPESGIGNPEKLKYHLSGYWSRRINDKDRLIYQIIEEPERHVVIVSALGHYE